MGQDHGAGSAIIDEALGLAERLAEAADQGKVDLNDLGRRAHAAAREDRRARRPRSSSSLVSDLTEFDDKLAAVEDAPPTTDRPGRLSFLRLLAVDTRPLRESRDFRRLWLGQAVSYFGNMITFVAVPFQVYSLTHSTLQVGLLSLCDAVPADPLRRDRRHDRRPARPAEVMLVVRGRADGRLDACSRVNAFLAVAAGLGALRARDARGVVLGARRRRRSAR